MSKAKSIAALAVAFTAVYAVGPFAAHAKQIEHSLQRAAEVRAAKTPVPGKWQLTWNYQDDQGQDDDFRIGTMGG